MNLIFSLIISGLVVTAKVYSQTLPEMDLPVNVCKGESFRNKLTQAQMMRQCQKEAARYKKNLFKKLLKQGATREAFRVLLMRKKKFLTTDKTSLDVKLNQDITNLSDTQLQELILTTLKDEIGRPNYPKVDFIFPIEIILQNDEGKLCRLDMKAPPELEVKNPSECEFCESVDVIKTFVDDCSYFVSENLTEKQALALLGGNLETKGRFCQIKNVPQSDPKGLNQFGDRICELLQSGQDLPQLEMISTRNLYRDKTTELAKKRGEFIRKYLYHYLTQSKSSCTFEGEIPEVLKSFSEFNKKFQDSFVFVYDGNNSGDYGPNPYAKTSEYRLEIKRYNDHLEKLIQSHVKLISQYQNEIVKIKSRSDELRRSFEELKESYTFLKEEDDVASVKKRASEIASEMLQLNSQISYEEQMIYNYLKRISSTQRKLSQLVQDKEIKVNLLREFYQDPVKNKKIWDLKLFDSFKIAKISFTPEVIDEMDEVMDAFDPEVKKYLQGLLSMDVFTCRIKERKYSKKPKFLSSQIP